MKFKTDQSKTIILNRCDVEGFCSHFVEVKLWQINFYLILIFLPNQKKRWNVKTSRDSQFSTFPFSDPVGVSRGWGEWRDLAIRPTTQKIKEENYNERICTLIVNVNWKTGESNRTPTPHPNTWFRLLRTVVNSHNMRCTCELSLC